MWLLWMDAPESRRPWGGTLPLTARPSGSRNRWQLRFNPGLFERHGLAMILTRKNLIRSVAAAAVLFAAHPSRSSKDKVLRHLVTVWVGDTRVGAGVVMAVDEARNRLVVASARHILLFQNGEWRQKSIWVESPISVGTRMQAQSVDEFDADIDLVVLLVQLRDHNLESSRLPRLSRVPNPMPSFPIGVHSAGCPHQKRLAFSGAIGTMKNRIVRGIIRYSASEPMVEGYSGGGVFAELGSKLQLIGMITGDGPVETTAFSIDLLVDLFRDAGYPVDLRDSEPPLISDNTSGSVRGSSFSLPALFQFGSAAFFGVAGGATLAYAKSLADDANELYADYSNARWDDAAGAWRAYDKKLAFANKVGNVALVLLGTTLILSVTGALTQGYSAESSTAMRTENSVATTSSWSCTMVSWSYLW